MLEETTLMTIRTLAAPNRMRWCIGR